MKIAIIIENNPFIQSSASANRWLTLIEGLVNLGSKVEIFIYGGYSSLNELNKWQKQGKYNDIRYNYVSTLLLQGYWQKRFDIYVGKKVRENSLINKIINEVGYENDVIWTDSTMFGFKLAYKWNKLKKKGKLFLEMSEYLDIYKNNKSNYFQRKKEKKRESFFENKTFYAYDGLAFMTKTLLNHYQAFPKPQPRFLHLPMTVDLERFQKAKECLEEFKSPYIVFVGVMNDTKEGVSILINAFNSIKNKFPNYKLYLVGARNYDTPIHLQLIKNLGLESKVFWMKEYSRDLIPNIICNADLLVLPRPDSKQAQGGFPTKLGEYLASGNPVCATRVGEIPNYLSDNESVFFADPGSVESFAEAMGRALSNPEISKKIGNNGREVAKKHFNKDIQSKKLYNFIKEIANDTN